MKDQRAPLHWSLLVLPLLLTVVIFGTRAPAAAQAQFVEMKSVLKSTGAT